MAKKLLNLTTFGLVSSLSKKKKAPEPVAQPSEPVMPTADDEAIRQARRRSISRQFSRGGRASTLLTSDTETLGG